MVKWAQTIGFATAIVFWSVVPGSVPGGETGGSLPSQLVCIKGVPHIRQKPDFCGEACVAMWAQKLGYKITQDDVFNASKLNPSLGRGCYTPNLKNALLALGFKVDSDRDIWKPVRTVRTDAEMKARFKDLCADLRKGIPSIVCTRYDEKPKSPEHFRLILGYDPGSDEVIYHDPAEENGAYMRMKQSDFLKLWPLKYRTKEWIVIRFRLRGGKIKPPKLPRGGEKTLTSADYAQHILKLKRQPLLENLTYVVEKPFVVVGNESPSAVRRRAAKTVRWAVRLLKKDFFAKDPDHIITIWLLGDKSSYAAVAKAVTHSPPKTPFGFFSSSQQCMVMNIDTGGGTLVHEIVHALLAPNFPKCPAWFNEGLASLYEQCDITDGRIVGYTNWRLAGLKKAIRTGAVPSFKKLTGATTRQFYGAGSGVRYAQARYLCYYLQEKGLLRAFYKQFHANYEQDPTGYKTLVEILHARDMDQFKKEGEKYCMKLRFSG